MTEVRIHNKRLIIGLGMTGISAARWCQRRGLAFDLCDTRASLPAVDKLRAEFPAAEIYTGPLDGDRLSAYEQLIVSPGVALAEAAIQQAIRAGVAVSGDIQLFADHCQKPVIAITGSNGKSTVTTLTGELLQAAGLTVAVGGNIGVPALDLGDADVYVLEVSSFQLETTAVLAAHAAVILNLSEDHMDRYQGMADYLQAKQRIFCGAANIIVNRDDGATRPPQGGEFVSFGLSAPAAGEFGLLESDGQRWICYGAEKLVSSAQLKIKGLHNLANVMAALALIRTLDIRPAQVMAALKNFAGLEHRCQWLGEKDGVAFYNDSKATNVASALAAVNGLGPEINGRIYLLAGGDGKGQNFSPLAPACRDYVAEVLTYGRDGEQIATALGDACRVSRWSTLQDAFAAAAAMARAGDVVLLSPACASFDQFSGYAQRGDVFRALTMEVL